MRHHPLFVLDSRERFEPVTVEAVQECARIGRSRPVVGALPPEGGRMDFPPEPEKWAPAVQGRYGGVGYLRRAELPGGIVALQYWLAYLDNPGPPSLRGVGRHEFDWEFVQVLYARDIPFAMTASQHNGGEARNWWDVEVRRAPLPPREVRPVIYVALGSHANYFEPVRGSVGDDVCDGKGKVFDLVWREFGPWASWPGRWGNSTGVGQSPESPGCQGDRWHAPHRFHTRAR